MLVALTLYAMFVKVAINWREVTYTQIDADVDLSDFTLRKNNAGYIVVNNGTSCSPFLHRWVMGLEKGDKRQVHHINGDRTDNKRCNLEVVTCTENNRARGRMMNNTSGLIGVYKRLNNGKYVAYIGRRENGKRKKRNLGAYWDKDEAGKAYDTAVRARGGIGVCNFASRKADKFD